MINQKLRRICSLALSLFLIGFTVQAEETEKVPAMFCTYELQNEWNETIETITRTAIVRNSGTIKRKVCDLASRECEALACNLKIADSYCIKKRTGSFEGHVNPVNLREEAQRYGEYEGRQNCGSRYLSRFVEDCWYGYYNGGACFWGRCHHGRNPYHRYYAPFNNRFHGFVHYRGNSCNYIRRGGSPARRREYRRPNPDAPQPPTPPIADRDGNRNHLPPLPPVIRDNGGEHVDPPVNRGSDDDVSTRFGFEVIGGGEVPGL